MQLRAAADAEPYDVRTVMHASIDYALDQPTLTEDVPSERPPASMQAPPATPFSIPNAAPTRPDMVLDRQEIDFEGCVRGDTLVGRIVLATDGHTLRQLGLAAVPEITWARLAAALLARRQDTVCDGVEWLHALRTSAAQPAGPDAMLLGHELELGARDSPAANSAHRKLSAEVLSSRSAVGPSLTPMEKELKGLLGDNAPPLASSSGSMHSIAGASGGSAASDEALVTAAKAIVEARAALEAAKENDFVEWGWAVCLAHLHDAAVKLHHVRNAAASWRLVAAMHKCNENLPEARKGKELAEQVAAYTVAMDGPGGVVEAAKAILGVAGDDVATYVLPRADIVLAAEGILECRAALEVAQQAAGEFAVVADNAEAGLSALERATEALVGALNEPSARPLINGIRTQLDHLRQVCL